ncbi:MAG: Cna B-type domain-containing protein, partial [Carnobacterium sp.]
MPVENYETKIEGATITNTYRNTETTSVSGEKIWDDYNNKFNTRPESITVQLMQNGSPFQETTVKVDEKGVWQYAFTNIAKYDETGNAYSYTVQEMPVENYETKIEGATITNTYRNTETTSVSGEKIWDDYNNKFNTRPESITVQLMQNGSPFQETTVKVDEKGVWQYAFTNIAKYDETGNAYSYTVQEMPVENYETKIEGATITNTYRNTETTSISGEKIWDDENNKYQKRPNSITINLFKNGEKLDVKTVSEGENGSWIFKFDQLEKYDETGELINYTISEEIVEGYTSSIEGTTITNTYKQLGKLGTPRNMIKKTTDEQVRELPKTNEIVTNVGTMVGGILLIMSLFLARMNYRKN